MAYPIWGWHGVSWVYFTALWFAACRGMLLARARARMRVLTRTSTHTHTHTHTHQLINKLAKEYREMQGTSPPAPPDKTKSSHFAPSPPLPAPSNEDSEPQPPPTPPPPPPPDSHAVPTCDAAGPRIYDITVPPSQAAGGALAQTHRRSGDGEKGPEEEELIAADDEGDEEVPDSQSSH